MASDNINPVKVKFNEYRLKFEEYLTSSAHIRSKDVPEKLFEAMEYSLNAGGKRLRPALCMAAAESCGCCAEDALPMALGLEMLHTATLIHDDLPCMDDDDMRRGRPSNHKKFGEAMAVLAGDALLAQSIEYPLANLSLAKIAPQKVINAMRIFTAAIGPSGVCGGQVLDMEPPAQRQSEDAVYVRNVAALKTGALIRSSVLTGAALGSDDSQRLECYANYGTHLGSAFQIVDDILDVTSTAEELGKTPGKDAEQDKITHVSVFGLEGARRAACSEATAAKRALDGLSLQGNILLGLPDYLTYRKN